MLPDGRHGDFLLDALHYSEEVGLHRSKDRCLLLPRLRFFFHCELGRVELSLNVLEGLLLDLLMLVQRLLPLELLSLALAFRGLQGLDLRIHVIHVREKRIVFAFEAYENLHDILDLLDACGLLYDSKRLLEHLDALLVLLDVPPLDAVEERRLHYAAHHQRLGEEGLLLGDDEAALLLHASLRPFQPDLNLLLLPIVVLELIPTAHDLLFEAAAFALALTLHDGDAMAHIAIDGLARRHLLHKISELRRAGLDLVAEPIEKRIALQPSVAQDVDLIVELHRVMLQTVEPLLAHVQPPHKQTRRRLPCVDGSVSVASANGGSRAW
mmetsp:Transcript_87542/g.245916  ORF Transcript_87542/g.245916 Transcript_87542/m.245916 type:complete len:325 (+) Transcript_87542:1278-2252(+)